jgi:hypothetical protein
MSGGMLRKTNAMNTSVFLQVTEIFGLVISRDSKILGVVVGLIRKY